MDRAGRSIETHMKEEGLRGEIILTIDAIFGVALCS